jgi:RNA polymerase sigma factor (sigma-70 family)
LPEKNGGTANQVEKNQIEERNRFIEENMGLVVAKVKEIHRKLPPKFELEDMINDGVAEACESLDRYDPSKGMKKTSYLGNCIKWGVLSGLEKRFKPFKRENSLDDLEDFEKDAIFNRSTENSDRQVNYDNHFSQFISEAVKKLPAIEQTVIQEHYYNGLEFGDIAKILTLNKNQVYQLHSTTLEKMASHLSISMNGDLTSLRAGGCMKKINSEEELSTTEQLKKLPLFSDSFSEQELTEIGKKFRLERHTRTKTIFGKMISLEGENIQWVYVVIEGWIKSLRSDKNGVKTIMALYEKGDILGEAELLQAIPATTTFITMEDCLLACISKTDFNLLLENPNFARGIINMMSLRLKEAWVRLHEFNVLSAPERVEKTFTETRARGIKMTGTEIAGLACTRRETAARYLSNRVSQT